MLSVPPGGEKLRQQKREQIVQILDAFLGSENAKKTGQVNFSED
jgi:hypothetical protein